MSESGSLLAATSLLVPCKTACDPSGHVAFRIVARQLTTMCRMAPQSRCPQMQREDPDHLWILSTPRRRAGKGRGVPSTWSEEGRCGLKPTTLTTLSEDTCGKRSGAVLSISSEIWTPVDHPDRWDRMLCHALRHQQTASPRRGISIQESPPSTLRQLVPDDGSWCGSRD
jgi:hypothetical protein